MDSATVSPTSAVMIPVSQTSAVMIPVSPTSAVMIPVSPTSAVMRTMKQKRPDIQLYQPPAFRHPALDGRRRQTTCGNQIQSVSIERSVDGGLLSFHVEGGEDWEAEIAHKTCPKPTRNHPYRRPSIQYVRSRTGMLKDLVLEGGEDWSQDLMCTAPDTNSSAPSASIWEKDVVVPQQTQSWADQVEDFIPLKEWTILVNNIYGTHQEW